MTSAAGTYGAYLDWLDYGARNWIAGGPDPDGPVEWCVPYYDRDLNYSMNLPEHSVPLFWTHTALQVSVHDRRFAERIYEGAIRKAHVEPDGAMPSSWARNSSDPRSLMTRGGRSRPWRARANSATGTAMRP